MRSKKTNNDHLPKSITDKNQKVDLARNISGGNLYLVSEGSAVNTTPLTKRQKIYTQMNAFLDSTPWTILMLLITIFALFGDDFRAAVFKPSADEGFSGAMIACLVLFIIEIVLAFICKPEYRFSFFFWLDILSTVSLLFDIKWIWSLIQGTSSSSLVQSSQVARASRASRAGTRAARIIRVIRVIRLIRIVKLYKIAQARLKDKGAELMRGTVSCRGPYEGQLMLGKGEMERVEVKEDSISQDFDSFGNCEDKEAIDNPQDSSLGNKKFTTYKKSMTIGDQNAELTQESKVGKKLSELTTMRVITLVLIMIIILPLFNLNIWVSIDQYELGLKMIDFYVKDSPSEAEFMFDEYVSQYENDSPPLIYLNVTNLKLFKTSTDPDSLRESDVEIVTINSDNTYKYFSYAIFDLSSQNSLQAGINMLKTLFICIVLTTGSVMFSKDTNTIILEPLENMIRTVKNIAKNPLQAVQEEEKNSLIKEDISSTTIIKTQAPKKMMETEILERLIIKIGALMALGFGEAGSEIIARNMEQSKGDVDPLVPGKRQLCIFGFCDIRQFPDVTEVLEEEIMIYVNEIALIVHKCVDQCLGTTNRNLGDVFVLVWKFPDQVVTKDRNKTKMLIAMHPFIPQFSDLSVISYIKIIAELNRNLSILKYNENDAILDKLPNFKVKMGFGLHFGWGIEGAIGSEYKIDASYLSPNVNLASRLCAATKQYGVWMLISEQVHCLLSEKMKNILRRVDRCTFKGSAEPMSIYTVDLLTSTLESYAPPVMTERNKKRARVTQRISREELRKDLWSGAYKAVRLLKEDPILKEMLSARNPVFVDLFETAISDYLNGQWTVAREGFEKALALKPDDGPCKNMIHFIDEYGGTPPSNWDGYRKLLEK